MMRRRNARSAAVLALLIAVALPAGAEDAPDWAYALPHELMSPFCPGVTVAECSSSGAKSMAAWIVVQAAGGRSREDVLADLYERYGDDIRATPRAEGWGIAAYVLPVVAFLGGGGFLGWFLRRSTRSPSGSPQPAPLDPAAERELDALLERRGGDGETV